MIETTEKLFYRDSHMTTFTANVMDCQEKDGNYVVILDRTAFFPEEGGQYADTGTLDDVAVLDVYEKDGVIYHVTDQWMEPGTGSVVTGRIHWDERFMKMQQHTGEHIVSGLVNERFGYNNVGFHLGTTDCTMDFNGEITKEELLEIERKANEAVVQNLDVEVTYPSKMELENISYRSKIEIEGQVRIVTIPGYDVCACCAPHVNTTGEIGQIKLTNVQRYKGGVRVTMLCGFRALDDYHRKLQATKQISAALCAKEDETVEAVEHLQEENTGLKQRILGLQRELLSYKVKEVPAQAETVCLFEEALEGELPRLLMNLVLDAGHKVCAVFSGGKDGNYRYVIGSRQVNLRSLVQEFNQAFQGRGGGKPEMVQGSLVGEPEELRVWMEEKVRNLEHE